tara:strand:+ start:131 stop:868 length:738 start_codon:yes stop_codon:yes gene_type:complete
MTIKTTYYGANGWLIEINKYRLLVDPWFTGDLTFPPGDWLIKGTLGTEIETPINIDLLVLTQGQPDHSHPPTLNTLDKSIQVVASHAAGKVVNKLGFTKVNILKPGETFNFKRLKIQATSGASVPNLENGYIIDCELDSLYIEPHGFLDKNIKPRSVDLVITPVVDFALPIAGKFINGKTILPELIKVFNPSTVLASTTGGDITFSGLINNFIKVDGTIEEINSINNLGTHLLDPVPLHEYIFNK